LSILGDLRFFPADWAGLAIGPKIILLVGQLYGLGVEALVWLAPYLYTNSCTITPSAGAAG
jgi:hypothetical protein